MKNIYFFFIITIIIFCNGCVYIINSDDYSKYKVEDFGDYPSNYREIVTEYVSKNIGNYTNIFFGNPPEKGIGGKNKEYLGYVGEVSLDVKRIGFPDALIPQENLTTLNFSGISTSKNYMYLIRNGVVKIFEKKTIF